MPKIKRNRPEVFQTWFDSDPEGFKDIRIQRNYLFCTVCERIINSSDKTKVTRHLKSHASSSANNSVFFYELTEAFLASNIPLNKLENLKLRTFLEKYMGRKIPHESTLRLAYVDRVYNNVVTSIRQDIADNFVYFIIDEATDACGRSVANFLIGALKSDAASNSHLVASKVLDKTNSKTIVNFVNDCFNYIWPDQDATDNVLVMLTDAAAYMLKAGDILSKKYTKMIHFTCAAHALNRVAEKVMDSFPLVNTFISTVKKVFIKAPMRRDVFRELLPDTPLPPEPVITRWGTWLEAVAYYDTYFDGIKDVIYRLNPSDSGAIHTLQDLLKDQNIRDDIHYINRHYGFLVCAIKILESHGLSLHEQFEIMSDVQKNIYDTNNIRPVSNTIKERMQIVLKKNPGYFILENICKVLVGTYQELPKNILLYSSCLKNFSYCPLSTVDVERSFSLHKLILSDKRRRFSLEHLEKHIVICFNRRQPAMEIVSQH